MLGQEKLQGEKLNALGQLGLEQGVLWDGKKLDSEGVVEALINTLEGKYRDDVLCRASASPVLVSLKNDLKEKPMLFYVVEEKKNPAGGPPPTPGPTTPISLLPHHSESEVVMVSVKYKDFRQGSLYWSKERPLFGFVSRRIHSLPRKTKTSKRESYELAGALYTLVQRVSEDHKVPRSKLSSVTVPEAARLLNYVALQKQLPQPSSSSAIVKERGTEDASAILSSLPPPAPPATSLSNLSKPSSAVPSTSPSSSTSNLPTAIPPSYYPHPSTGGGHFAPVLTTRSGFMSRTPDGTFVEAIPSEHGMVFYPTQQALLHDQPYGKNLSSALTSHNTAPAGYSAPQQLHNLVQSSASLQTPHPTLHDRSYIYRDSMAFQPTVPSHAHSQTQQPTFPWASIPQYGHPLGNGVEQQQQQQQPFVPTQNITQSQYFTTYSSSSPTKAGEPMFPTAGFVSPVAGTFMDSHAFSSTQQHSSNYMNNPQTSVAHFEEQPSRSGRKRLKSPSGSGPQSKPTSPSGEKPLKRDKVTSSNANSNSNNDSVVNSQIVLCLPLRSNVGASLKRFAEQVFDGPETLSWWYSAWGRLLEIQENVNTLEKLFATLDPRLHLSFAFPPDSLDPSRPIGEIHMQGPSLLTLFGASLVVFASDSARQIVGCDPAGETGFFKSRTDSKLIGLCYVLSRYYHRKSLNICTQSIYKLTDGRRVVLRLVMELISVSASSCVLRVLFQDVSPQFTHILSLPSVPCVE